MHLNFIGSGKLCCSATALMMFDYDVFWLFFSAEIEQKYQEIMKQTGILTLNGQVC